MAVNVELNDEIEDLDTCCVCTHLYDENQHLPKYLYCFHTFCFSCIKRLIDRSTALRCILCPKCKQASDIFFHTCGSLAGTPKLQTNPYALKDVKVRAELKFKLEYGQRLCTNCNAGPKQSCVKQGHEIGDFKKDIQAMVGRNGELQTAASNRLKLVVYKHAKVHELWNNQVLKAQVVVQQSNATVEHAKTVAEFAKAALESAKEKKQEAGSRLDQWNFKQKQCEKRKRQSCDNGNVTSFSAIMEKTTETLREAEKEDQEVDKILESLENANTKAATREIAIENEIADPLDSPVITYNGISRNNSRQTTEVNRNGDLQPAAFVSKHA